MVSSNPEYEQAATKHDDKSTVDSMEGTPKSPLGSVREHIFLYCCAINASLGSLSFTYNMIVTNTLTSTLANLYEWSDDEKETYVGLITSASFGSAAVGTLLFWRVGQKYGRWKILVLANIFCMLPGSILCGIKSLPALIAGRLLIGLAMSLLGLNLPAYFREIPPPNLRGAIGGFHQLQFGIGTTVAFTLSLGLPEPTEANRDNDYWRLMFWFTALLAVVQLIGYFTVFRFDTPKSLWQHGKHEEAERVLKKLQTDDEVQVSLNSLRIVEKEVSKLGFKDLKLKENYHPVLIGFGVILAMNFGGISSIFMYSTDLFASVDSEGSNKDQVMATFLYVGITNLLACIMGFILGAKIRRRVMFLLGFGGCTLAGFTISLADTIDASWMVKVGVLIFIIAFEVGGGSLMWTYCAEIMEPEFLVGPRLCHWVTLFINGLIIIMMFNSLGISTTFLIFAIVNIIAAWFTIKLLPETRGLTSEQIKDLFKPAREPVAKADIV